MDWEQLRYWWKSSEVVYIHEPLQRSYGYGMLRSLPAINRINMITRWENTEQEISSEPYGWFTYPKQWRQLGNVDQFGMEPHEWRVLDDINPVLEPVCATTNMHYEQQLPYSIGPLVSKCRRSGQSVYVLADDEDFQIASATRPLREERYTFPVDRGYPEVYASLQEFYQSQGINFPLVDTRNVFLQDNAFLFNEIHSGSRVTSAVDLFEVLPKAPYLPLYGSMVQIFNRNDSKGADAIPSEELDALRKWLMRRINWTSSTARNIAESLNEKVLADANIFAAPTRVNHPTLIDVRSYIDDLKHQSSPIHQIYCQWLKKGTQV